MKKIYLIVFCLIAFASANAQLYIDNPKIRTLFKAIAAGTYGGGVSCPTCFKGDTLMGGDFYSYTNDAWNVQGLQGIIDISNSNVNSLEPFRSFGWGRYENPANYGLNYFTCGVTAFYCNNNYITDISPIDGISFYSLDCKNNQITGHINTPTDFNIGFGATCSNPNMTHYFDYSNNQITSVSIAKYGIGQDLNLNLSHNNLSGILGISNFSSSYYGLIDFSYNNFSSFKGNLPSAYNVKDINVSHNPNLDSVSVSINNDCPPLNFSHCNISSFDLDKYNSYRQVGSLDISYNNLTEIPELGTPTGGGIMILPSLDLSHNKIKTAQFLRKDSIDPWGNIYPFNPFTEHLYLSNIQGLYYLDISNNIIDSISGDFPATGTIKIDSNNLYCLPKIPATVGTLYFDTAKITCLANVGAFKINGTNSRVFTVCNAVNNSNQCQGFPTVAGVVYYDANKNHIKDTGDTWFANAQVKLRVNNKTYTTFTNNNGEYAVSADTIGSYKVTITAPKYHTAFPDSLTGVFTAFGYTNNLDTAHLQLTTVFDSIISYSVLQSAVRPGFLINIFNHTANFGSTTLSPTVTLQFDSSKLEYVNNDCGAVNGSNVISRTINNLMPNKSSDCYTTLRVKPTVNIGDTILITTSVTYNGITTYNAIVDYIAAPITGSFDPNDKLATPELTTTQVATGKYIDYTIHFQNTGNDTAFTVVIADTLSSLLQANTLQMIGSSHNCKTTINGNKIYFEFLNILLPDSNVNQLGSNGFVRFRVKPLSTLVAGNIVPNKASIYFDYNAPVLTNVATTTIKNASVLPLSIINYQLMAKDMQVENNWITSNEVNVSHFNIQRSTNAQDFVTMGKVKANNKSSNNYTFNDALKPNNQYPTILYYRLQAIDNNGQTSYSAVKQIRLNQLNGQSISIYPNPAKDYFTIESKGIKKATINDCFGRIICLLNNITDHQTINTKQWSKGLYIISFDNGEKAKIVIE